MLVTELIPKHDQHSKNCLIEHRFCFNDTVPGLFCAEFLIDPYFECLNRTVVCLFMQDAERKMELPGLHREGESPVYSFRILVKKFLYVKMIGTSYIIVCTGFMLYA